MKEIIWNYGMSVKSKDEIRMLLKEQAERDADLNNRNTIKESLENFDRGVLDYYSLADDLMEAED